MYFFDKADFYIVQSCLKRQELDFDPFVSLALLTVMERWIIFIMNSNPILKYKTDMWFCDNSVVEMAMNMLETLQQCYVLL